MTHQTTAARYALAGALLTLAWAGTVRAGATLAPDAFSAQNAYRDATTLAQDYPHRQAGSTSDNAIACETGGKPPPDVPPGTERPGRPPRR